MQRQIQEIAKAIVERFGAEMIEFRDQLSLVVSPEKIVDVCRVLQGEYGFEVLLGQTAVDYWPAQKPRFHVIYLLLSLSHNQHLTLRVPVDGNAPSLPTVEGVFPNANWHEREVWDMFGIRFDGHTDLRRILMPYDWQGHPLRKDYPLGYEEVQFTFNYDEIDERKPYAKE